MPQRDRYHQLVRRALEKAGWTITKDPLILPFDTTRVFVDLAAQSSVQNGAPAEIIVEIKVMSGGAFVDELESALGQYIIYRGLLELYLPQSYLYLAVPLSVYKARLQGRDISYLLSRNQIHLMIYDETQEEIVQWIRQSGTPT